jgi:hypothetical protein
VTLEDRARELAERLPDYVVTIFSPGDDYAEVSVPNAEALLLAEFQAVRRQALEEAIQATRAAFKHGHETFGETAIRALIYAPSGGQHDI